jgi:hypothetical protein
MCKRVRSGNTIDLKAILRLVIFQRFFRATAKITVGFYTKFLLKAPNRSPFNPRNKMAIPVSLVQCVVDGATPCTPRQGSTFI